MPRAVSRVQVTASGALKALNEWNNRVFDFFIATEPYLEYKLWLKAYTWKNEGDPSEPLLVRTDVRGPNAPRIANLTCHNADTLFLQWHRPSVYNRSIDLYYIYYRYAASMFSNRY